MRFVTVVLLSAFVSLPAAAKTQACAVLPQLYELAKLLSDGNATLYKDSVVYREVILDDATSDSRPGCVALFHLGGWGGGNTNRQYLASFVKNDPGDNFSRLVDFELVGEKFAGALRIDNVEPGKLFVTTLIRDNHEVVQQQGVIRITTRDIKWDNRD